MTDTIPYDRPRPDVDEALEKFFDTAIEWAMRACAGYIPVAPGKDFNKVHDQYQALMRCQAEAQEAS